MPGTNFNALPPRSGVLALYLSLLVPIASQAQFPTPPTIEVLNTGRSVDVSLSAEGFDTNRNNETMIPGPFVDIFVAQGTGTAGTFVGGAASQNTSISSFSVVGTGSGSVTATISAEGFALTDGLSDLLLLFTIPINGPFSLTGMLNSISQSEASSSATVTLVGVRPDNFPFFYSMTSQSGIGISDGEVPFSFNDVMKANTQATLSIAAGSSIGITATGSPSAEASFDFVFDFGDRDGDGLLNVWEEDGIDVDGDQNPEIDLPSYGADPDRKDLFVEVDVMAGVVFDQAAFTLVEEAFAQAPQWLIDNPVPQNPPIKLHVIWNDGDTVPNQPLVDPFNAVGENPSPFQMIKNGYFGSAADRGRSDWLTELKRARLRVFRYCVFANDLMDGGSRLNGLAEAPGNDFIVPAGWLGLIAQQKTKGLAGAFMHELGHNLGLSHGGQDNENFKPNYISIMNGAYAVPWLVATTQGTNAADYWRLDYSRSAPRNLNESSLIESEGLDGPSGRIILFNTVGQGSGLPPKLSLDWASASIVDWNDNGFNDQDAYFLDISHFRAAQGFSLDTLVSYTDWDRLWYHLSGEVTFNDGAPPDPEFLKPGISVDTIEEVLAAEWTDQTALGEEVFSNGFELGSFTAWSAAVP